jgi:hypothetical protein
VRFPNHGGLTTPVLVVVSQVTEQRSILTARGRFNTPRRAHARRSWKTCVCAPRMSLFFSGPTSCTRSGWRKPAMVVKRIARAKGNRMFATIRMRPSRAAPGAAGVSRPWRREATVRGETLSVRKKPIAVASANRTHGGLTATVLRVVSLVAEQRSILTGRGRFCTPRRANARRSCAHAFVHRKNRYFAGGHSHANTRAGGVSPPWIRYRDCTGVRHRTVDRLPRLCGSVLTSAFP